MENFSLETTTINELFFEVMKRETKALFQPTNNDELRIEVSHRFI